MTLRELTKLIALCRKTGVSSIKMEGIELQLGPAPYKAQAKPKIVMTEFDPGQVPKPWSPGEPVPYAPEVQELIQTDMLQGDALLFYSSDGNSQ